MSLYWFGTPVVDVLAYWSDGTDTVARFLIEGDPRPRCAYASMLEVTR